MKIVALALATALSAPSATAQPGPAPTSIATAPTISFAKVVERTLLSNGISALVYSETSTKLGIFAYLNQSLVYQIAVDARLLEGARRAGYRTVDFFDKGGSGHWTFDVSKGVPACDIRKRLCF